jgi:hypothetical protein
LKKIIRGALVSVLLVLSAPAIADTMPDAMLGYWNFLSSNDGTGARVNEGEEDLYVKKDKYYGVDDECTIMHVDKLRENLYKVQANCIDNFETINQFELLKNGHLLITPETGS